MNENLNLVEILKNVPEGTKLWSPICGECYFREIVAEEGCCPLIACSTKTIDGDYKKICFTKEGKRNFNGECVLFPSRENRDWSTFKAPKKHKHFEPFQKVLVKSYITHDEPIWCCALYSHYDESRNRHYFVNFGFSTEDDNVIPYEGNEDKAGKPVE